ncbi:hypothetical protein NS341_07460 [Staphylococcus xylosus]|uniref:phage baseplate protein n=1 Tax=Staphylococcus xylosus TaxID=1288 RepID=UPI000734E1DC|nr:hypothetical protein [Staphylococcus xylosus]KTW22482.1 hypothetical protein NS341_07460 [Staphylococcus xylosus]
MLKLKKSLESTLGQDFRQSLHTNFLRTEDFVNNFAEQFRYHKEEELNAHGSKQISDERFKTVERGLNVINSRYNNLILSKGKNSLQEVKDARVDSEGTAHATLFDRLQSDSIKSELNKDEVMTSVEDAKEQVLAQEFAFDIPNQSWQYLTHMSPFTNSVMQSFWVDNKSGLIYMTNAYGSNYKLTKMKANGQLLSQMEIDGGGHGTHLAYLHDDVNEKLWLYTHIKRPDGFNALVRFTYKPNEIITYGDYDMEEVYTGHPERPYITPIINEHEGLMLYRIEYPKSEWDVRGARNYVEIRTLEDIENKVDRVLYRMDIPMRLTSGTQPMQGVTFDDGKLYWYTGDSDPNVPNLVTVFDLKTKKQLYQKQADIGGLGKNGPEANFAEAEGMQMYYDRETGKKALLIGVTTGGANYRSHEIHGIFMRDVYEKLRSQSTPVLMTDSGGKVKTYPLDTFTKIADVTEPGHYYMTTATTMQLTDFPLPQEMRDAGFFLEVSAPNVAGDVKQTLTRNSYARDLMIFQRMVSIYKLGGAKESYTNWNHVKSNSIDGPAEAIPTHLTNMNQLGIITNKRWYCDTARSSQIKDHPNPGVAGWTVDVESVTSGAFKVVLTRVTSGASIQKYEAYFSTSKNERTSPWTLFQGEKA